MFLAQVQEHEQLLMPTPKEHDFFFVFWVWYGIVYKVLPISSEPEKGSSIQEQRMGEAGVAALKWWQQGGN